jgi:hypothetical protein
MDTRNLLTVLAVVVCLATGWGVWRQRGQLADLRAEQARLRAAGESPVIEPVPEVSQPAVPAGQETPVPEKEVSPELLRLRNQVSQLSARKRELAGVAADADRLRTQMAFQQTNTPAGARLSPGYIRKAEARMVGFATPEDTVQSFLWALQQRNFTNLLQTVTPEVAQKLQAMVEQSGRSHDEFFKDSEVLPGLAIVGRETLPDGSVQLKVEMVPGVPPEKFVVRNVNGQWKLASPF